MYGDDFGSFLISMIWIFIFVMFFFVFLRVVMDLFSDHTMSGWGKALWIIFLILMPPLAVLIYLIARGKSMGERQMAAMAEAQKQQQEHIKSVAGTSAAPAAQIASAKSLLDSGAITQQEFDALKAKALA